MGKKPSPTDSTPPTTTDSIKPNKESPWTKIWVGVTTSLITLSIVSLLGHADPKAMVKFFGGVTLLEIQTLENRIKDLETKTQVMHPIEEGKGVTFVTSQHRSFNIHQNGDITVRDGNGTAIWAAGTVVH